MGLRFRKSINMGPVRVNFSKSGVGYSIGTKGARITKKANKNTMTTIGIPGTGFSYTKEISKKGKKKMNNKTNKIVDRDKIEVSANWIKQRLGLTDKEFELFVFLTTNFNNSNFIPKEVAEKGLSMATTVYSGLYNKNVINRNTDKSYCLNTSFINKIGEEYKDLMTEKQKQKKPFYKKTWVWAIIAIMCAMGFVTDTESDINTNNETTTTIIETTTEIPTITTSKYVFTTTEAETTTTPTTKFITTSIKTMNYFYVTEYGTKYHRSSCRHIKNSNTTKITEEDAKRNYEPCGTCNP